MNPTTPGRDDAAPALPRRRSKLAVTVPAIVLLLTLVLIAWSAWPVIRPARSVTVTQAIFDRAPPQPAASTPSPQAERLPPGPTVQAAGWLEAEPFYVACTALADGVIESISVLEGDFVERDQVVARLVSEDAELRLRRAEADLAAARAHHELAGADLRAAQSSWDEPVSLERAVATGTAALAEGIAELAQLPPLIDAAQATKRRLEEELTRTETSRSSGGASDLEAIIARRNLEAQAAEVTALEARDPLLRARVRRLEAELHAAERDLTLRIEDRRGLDAATAELARAGAAVERAAAARDEAALELDRMTIRAPITGYVQRRLKVPGDKVMRMMDDHHSAHLMHLYDPEQLQVRVDVPLADAAHVRVGQRCEVVVEVLPDRTFEGTVLRTTHEADLQKNTLEVKVQVLDPDPILRPEMLTRVRFLPASHGTGDPARQDEHTQARVLVPAAALDERDGSARVWIVAQRERARGVVHRVDVEPIERSDGWISVRGPVQPGALLAIPDVRLRDGQPVVIANNGRDS